ncbi:MAG: ribosome assembly RNA-binding protein YhbY [Lachnospiraceae bacterium]|nr:ribosome assembly RNA-binding protein YhbY [Lachnospiraceae bacterium]
MTELTSKQRSYLMKLAAAETPLFQIGKAGLTPEICNAISEALEARELVKVALLKNCFDDIRNLAEALAGRTRSLVVTVIGRKIVLYRPSKTKKVIELP